MSGKVRGDKLCWTPSPGVGRCCRTKRLGRLSRGRTGLLKTGRTQRVFSLKQRWHHQPSHCGWNRPQTHQLLLLLFVNFKTWHLFPCDTNKLQRLAAYSARNPCIYLQICTWPEYLVTTAIKENLVYRPTRSWQILRTYAVVWPLVQFWNKYFAAWQFTHTTAGNKKGTHT